MTDGNPFRILTVCTGNICRSPMTARLLQRALDTAFPDQIFSVTSAGTHALSGYEMDRQVRALLFGIGLAQEDFVARQISEQMIKSSDLILALARDHRRSVLEICPQYIRKTYTLKEFANLAQSARLAQDGQPARNLHNLVEWAPRLRTLNSNISKEALDVADPYKGTDSEYEKSYVDINSAVNNMVKGLTKSAETGGGQS